jgi:hypothetical protein
MVFNAPFNNISVSFIRGENWSTRRKPLTYRKKTLSHDVVSSTPKEEFFIVSVILVVRLKFVIR